MKVGQLASACDREIYVYRQEASKRLGRKPPERLALAGYVTGAANDALMDEEVRGVLRCTPLGMEPDFLMVWV